LSKQNPILPKDGVVDVAGRWGEGHYSYPGRLTLNGQKSAEAILAG